MAARRILQVEDEENDVILLRLALERAGVLEPVSVACDAKEAMEYLSGEGAFYNREEYPLPCLVLLDLKLPDLDGLEVLSWIRRQSQLKTVVVVALTSSNHERDIRRAYELGVNSYVVKPNSVEKRVELASHLKGWWLNCNTFCGSIPFES